MRGSSLVFVAVLLVGCQDGLEVSASEDSFCSELAEVACHNLYQCCTESDIEEDLGVSEPRTEAQCREDKTRRCEVSTARYRDSLAKNRVQFNPEAYNACLEAVLAPDDTCSTYVDKLPWTEPCDVSAWTGLIPMAGSCFFDHDCAGYPKSAECGSDQKCVTLPIGGFPCVNGNCAEDFFCGTGQICQARLAEGTPCDGSDECQDNLYCDFAAMPDPVCAGRKPAGTACTSNNGCISAQCIPGECALTGATCYSDAGCSSRCAGSSFQTCTFDYQCNTSGRCNTVTSQTCGGSTADADCVALSAGTTCIFNVSCVPDDCIGDPVCTAPLFLADYCEMGKIL